MAATLSTPTQEVSPIIIDLGKKKRKQIRDLKNGTGKLMAEVADVLNEVRANMGSDADGKQFIPVILVYRRKSRRKASGLTLPLPFLG